MDIEAILFDMGGVLRDSSQVMWEALKKAFEEKDINFALSISEVWHLRGITPLHSSKAFIGAYLNKGEELKGLLSLSFEEAKEKASSFITFSPVVDEIKALYKKYFNERRESAKPLPRHRRAFLMALRLRDLKLGIVSNAGNKSLERDLGKDFSLFDVIIGEEDMKEKKPSPQGILLALQNLSVVPSRAVYVGDTEVDALAAKSAKVKFFPVTTGMVKSEWWKEMGYEVLGDASALLNIV